MFHHPAVQGVAELRIEAPPRGDLSRLDGRSEGVRLPSLAVLIDDGACSKLGARGSACTGLEECISTQKLPNNVAHSRIVVIALWLPVHQAGCALLGMCAQQTLFRLCRTTSFHFPPLHAVFLLRQGFCGPFCIGMLSFAAGAGALPQRRVPLGTAGSSFALTLCRSALCSCLDK